MRAKWLAALSGLWFWAPLPALVAAAELPPIPDKQEAGIAKDVPEPWRTYLIQARAAERIVDPLQRCLAFPDIPANRWPAGHAQARCRDHFAMRRPSLGDIEGMVRRGEIDQLEALLERSLARHFSQGDFGEDIHDVFDIVLAGGDERTDQVTASWLQGAPESAFANLARAAYYGGAAWKARGGRLVEETPRENLRRMSQAVAQAIPYLQKAVAINPRLVPAYTQMISLGRADSRPDLEQVGVRGAEVHDPACSEYATQWMRSLSPRWSGSYEEMLAFSSRLSKYVSTRPGLAVQIAAPYADRGDRLLSGKQYAEALEVLRIAVAIGSDEAALVDAGEAAINMPGGSDAHEELAYFLQAMRFGVSDAWVQRQIARHLVSHEPEWALKYALGALQVDPDDTVAHYLAAVGYRTAGRYEDADREYRIAIEAPKRRQASLREVGAMWLYASGSGKAGAARAAPYIARLRREYPEDGYGWLMAVDEQIVRAERLDGELMRQAVSRSDPDDPWQAQRAKQLQSVLESLKATK